MQECQDLIIEFGTEELPPMSLNNMSLVFKEQMQTQLMLKGLTFNCVKPFATPRRIAVLVEKLIEKQPDQIKVKKGPALHLAFDEHDNPTDLLNRFLESLQINLSKLNKVLSADQKTGWVEYKQTISGVLTIDLIPEILEKAIVNLPSPKMNWGSEGHTFARPVHWILALFGDKIVNINLFGLKSCNITYGHRFLFPDPLVIKNPLEYPTKLAATGRVVADFKERKQLILRGIQEYENKLNATCRIDEVLLEQVTNMVEEPVVLCANFADRFLSLPHDCLISVMGHHQKSFALFDQNGKLLPKFILVSNMLIPDPCNIINGNEKVMLSRLQDAMFLYEQDLKTPISAMLEKLKTVVLEEKLGNMYEQSVRIQNIAVIICELLQSSTEDKLITEQAAILCKADLVSKMVLEFPELQGIMGGHYVQQHGMESSIATTIEQHYLPKFAEDKLPNNIPSLCLAIAYRLNLLCGMFAIGTISTGDKDPFSLRRHALAIIRMLIEKNLSLDLINLFKITLTIYQESNKFFAIQDVSNKLLSFCTERLKNWYLNTNLVTINVFNAVLVNFNGQLHDFDLRIKALMKFSKLEEFQSLASANKRVNKILEKIDLDLLKKYQINSQIFELPEESNLFEELTRLQKIIEPLIKSQAYGLVLQHLARLKPFVDNFFDHVMVMVPEQNIKQNRLGLLFMFKNLCSQIADIAEI